MPTRRRSRSFALAASTLVLVSACSEPTVPGLQSIEAQAHARRRPQTPPLDVQAPLPPAFAVLELGPTHVRLAWSSTDASQPLLYRVEKNGALVLYGFETSQTFAALQPSTTYAFTGKARDAAGNWSEYSAPFTVTTPAADATDVTPPTAPAGVYADLYGDGSRELQVTWGASTDNVTPQVAIIYHIYVNGVLDNSAVGKTQSSVYGVAGDNVISVIAVDGAGNRSAAASFSLFIPF